jgi:divalent metal cation (Fe/Co/Zn/Cd) transporter
VKFFAWYVTDLLVILSDALESIINVVGSAFAWYSIYLSGKPRDKEHPYGHGKIEFFSIVFE